MKILRHTIEAAMAAVAAIEQGLKASYYRDGQWQPPVFKFINKDSRTISLIIDHSDPILATNFLELLNRLMEEQGQNGYRFEYQITEVPA